MIPINNKKENNVDRNGIPIIDKPDEEMFGFDEEWDRKVTIPPCDKTDCVHYGVRVLWFSEQLQYRRVQCLQCMHFYRSLDNYERKGVDETSDNLTRKV